MWCGLASLRVEVFCWLVVAGKVSTVDVLRRKGLTLENINDRCSLCGREDETINHLFLHCDFAAFIWKHFLKVCGISWCLPSSLVDIVEGWRLGPFSGCGLLMWKCIPFAILWSIWKERNDRIFKGSQTAVEDTVPLVTLRLSKWLLCKIEFSNLKLDDIAQDWKVYMMSGPSKGKVIVSWSPPPIGSLKFNVDGATRGKPGRHWRSSL